MIFPEKPVIWVDPRQITLHAMPPGGYFAQQMQRHNPLDRVTSAPLGALWRKRLVYGGDWDLASEPVNGLRQYRWINDLAQHQTDFRASHWYGKACKALNRNGVYRHKTLQAHNLTEVDALFEREFLPLLSSMAKHGYKPTPGDWPLGVVDRHGRVLKSEKGRHRFAAACAVGLARFPLQIAAVHRLWAGSDRGAVLRARIMELEQQSP